ncbi:MAG: hypothetical protein NDF58_06205 [archaeon YNP-LCB-024-027]|nr:hypothetical protein [Candidatus Culexarchaeum yellowstonense]
MRTFKSCYTRKWGLFAIILLMLSIWHLRVFSSTYVYNPLNSTFNPVQPPIIFSNPNNPNATVILGEAYTSANVTLTRNLALNVYDEDENGTIYLEGPAPNIELPPGGYYNVSWSVHMASFEDPKGNGTMIIDLRFYNGSDYCLASIIYYGNYVKAALGLLWGINPASEGQSSPYTINPYQKHEFKIRVERSIDGCLLTLKWFVDGVNIYSYQYNITEITYVFIWESYFGWLNKEKPELKFEAYLDDVHAEGVYNASENFEDGVDDVFIIGESTGYTGKRISYYTYPQKFLLALNNYGVYNVSLEFESINGVIPSGFNASIWINLNSQYSRSAKVVNGLIVENRTSKILLQQNSILNLYVNVTATYPASWNVTLRILFKYEVEDYITVSYPLRVEAGYG